MRGRGGFVCWEGFLLLLVCCVQDALASPEVWGGLSALPPLLVDVLRRRGFLLDEHPGTTVAGSLAADEEEQGKQHEGEKSALRGGRRLKGGKGKGGGGLGPSFGLVFVAGMVKRARDIQKKKQRSGHAPGLADKPSTYYAGFAGGGANGAVAEKYRSWSIVEDEVTRQSSGRVSASRMAWEAAEDQQAYYAGRYTSRVTPASWPEVWKTPTAGAAPRGDSGSGGGPPPPSARSSRPRSAGGGWRTPGRGSSRVAPSPMVSARSSLSSVSTSTLTPGRSTAQSFWSSTGMMNGQGFPSGTILKASVRTAGGGLKLVSAQVKPGGAGLRFQRSRAMSSTF